MSFVYDIESSNKSVWVRGKGLVHMSSIVSIMDRVSADPRFRSHFKIILDIRNAQYTADLDDGHILTKAIIQNRHHFQEGIAMVVPDSLSFLARTYCQLSSLGGYDRMASFTDISEARRWCNAA